MRASLNCPMAEELALWIEGRAPAEGRAALETHLAGCDACRELWAAAGSAAEGVGAAPVDIAAILAAYGRSPAARAAGPPAPFRVTAWRVPAAAAAALAVVIFGVLTVLGPDPAAERSFTIPPGRAATPGEDPIAADGESFSLSLDDGSRVRLAPRARLRVLLPLPGARAHLELIEGTIDVEAVRDPRPFHVVADGGRVAVVGTTFRACALRVHLPGRKTGREGNETPSSFPLFLVRVAEGAVEVENDSGKVLVGAGRRAILTPGRPPFCQEAEPLDWRRALREIASEAPTADFERSPRVLTLLVGDWEGIASWEEAVSHPGMTPREREAAARLVGLTAQARDAERLRALAARFPEAARALAPHWARLTGDAPRPEDGTE